MPTAFLSGQSHFSLTGADASEFLQNLITTDVVSLKAGIAAPGALLTPQGKIMFFFLISRVGDGFQIETSSETADALVMRLSMYKLRSKVEISPPEQTGTSIWWEETPPDGAAKDIRFEKSGVSLSRMPGRHVETDDSAYTEIRTKAAVVEPPFDFALGDVFPHDVMLDLNGGLSFRKGCYVGQEVVSRMQHRSTARRRPVFLVADTALPASGTPITVDDKAIGEMGTVAAARGLAIVRIDKAGAALAEGKSIFAGDVPVTPSLPEWSGLSFPSTQAED